MGTWTCTYYFWCWTWNKIPVICMPKTIINDRSNTWIMKIILLQSIVFSNIQLWIALLIPEWIHYFNNESRRISLDSTIWCQHLSIISMFIHGEFCFHKDLFCISYHGMLLIFGTITNQKITTTFNE